MMDEKLLKLNRFTTVPFLIDLLVRRKLTLLNPQSWEDFNDRSTLEAFRRMSTGINSVYVMCLTYKSETVHHWNTFANGASGCCIEFNPERLFQYLDGNDIGEDHIRHGRVRYLPVRKLDMHKVKDVPFLKRLPFKPEMEYRIIVSSGKEQGPAYDLEIGLDAIHRVTISNKLPVVVYKSLKKTLLGICPELKGRISHSTLYRNKIWMDHFSAGHETGI